jgi:CelD/BcsL family acetyltransferase involved in cellulose biosynthesis
MSSAPGQPVVRLARSEDEALGLRGSWETLGTSHVDADLDYFLTSVRLRPEVLRPHVISVERNGQAVAHAVGWIERSRLTARIGYRKIHRPMLRILRVAHGGIAAADDEAAGSLVAALIASLGRDADVAVIPAAQPGSTFESALRAGVPATRREVAGSARPHHRLVLPATYEDLLAARDRKSRYNLRRTAEKLEAKYGESLSIELLSKPEDGDRIARDLEQVAAGAYQRALEAGFRDSAERRALTQLALERGWFRAWVLSIQGAPVAFWQGNVVDGVYYSSSTAYDPAFRADSVGVACQLRMFQDLCADPTVEIVDFGWGDADYKARFGTERWLEEDVILYAASLRAAQVHAARLAVQTADRLARKIARRLGILPLVKRLWRRQLSGAAAAR